MEARTDLAAVAPSPEPPADNVTIASAETVRSPWFEFWRKFRRQRVALIAGGFVALLVLMAIAAPLIAPFDPENFFDYDNLNK